MVFPVRWKRNRRGADLIAIFGGLPAAVCDVAAFRTHRGITWKPAFARRFRSGWPLAAAVVASAAHPMPGRPPGRTVHQLAVHQLGHELAALVQQHRLAAALRAVADVADDHVLATAAVDRFARDAIARVHDVVA